MSKADAQGRFVCECGSKLRFASATTTSNKQSKSAPPETTFTAASTTGSDLDSWSQLPPMETDPENTANLDALDLNTPAFDDASKMDVVDWGELALPNEATSHAITQDALMAQSFPSPSAKGNLQNATSRRTEINPKPSTSNHLLIIGICFGSLAFISVFVGISLLLLFGPSSLGTSATADQDVGEDATPGNSGVLVRVDSPERYEDLGLNKLEDAEAVRRNAHDFKDVVVDLPETFSYERHTLPPMGIPPAPIEPLKIDDTTELRKTLGRPHHSAMLDREGTVALVRRQEKFLNS